MRRTAVAAFFIFLFAGIYSLKWVPTPETIAFVRTLVDFSNSGVAKVLAVVVMLGGSAAAVAHCGIMGSVVGIGFAAFINWVPSLLLAAMLSANPTAATPAQAQGAPAVQAPVATLSAPVSQPKSK